VGGLVVSHAAVFHRLVENVDTCLADSQACTDRTINISLHLMIDVLSWAIRGHNK
jgi:hypothetical protein